MVVIILSIIIRNGNDAYHIKTEFVILAVLWVVLLPLWLMYPSGQFYYIVLLIQCRYFLLGLDSKWHLRASIVLLIGLYISFCTTTISFPLSTVSVYFLECEDIWPCIYVWRKEREDIPSSDEPLSEKQFHNSLGNIEFRYFSSLLLFCLSHKLCSNAFYEYLKLQLSSENLLCWEAIESYKILRKSGTAGAKTQAKMIFNKVCGN